MFKNMYQGGAVVEVFSAQGKDPVAKWKLYGGPSSICKVFDKEVKGYVYCLEGSCPNVKMQMPDDSKMSLGLVQRFLVLQVNVTQCKDFSIELVITDAGHLKRRLYLSTVHKEFSATPLHARIPFVGLKRNIWSSLCIDLVSFIGGLFTSSAFLTLDGITVSAGCKLRRIFTMKTGPEGMSDADPFFTGTGIIDLIPRSCQFLPDVQHVILVLNMQRTQQADVKTGHVDSYAADQTASSRSARSRRLRQIQDSSHIAFGSRVSGPPPQTGRKNGGPSSDGVDGGTAGHFHFTCPTSSTGTEPTCSTESGNLSEKSSLGESSQALHRNGSEFEHIVRLQPHPPKDRHGSKRKTHAAGRERLASSDAVAGGHRDRTEARETTSTASPCRGESSRRPLTPAEMTGGQTSDELLNHTHAKDEVRTRYSTSIVDSSSSPRSSPASFRSGPQHVVLQTSVKSDDEWPEPEPELTLEAEEEEEEDVFTFSSPPHSARRVQQAVVENQGQGGGGEQESSHHDAHTRTTRSCNGAQPEDDFMASESDEEEIYTKFFHQRASVVGSSPTTVRSPGAADLHLQPGCHDGIDQTLPEELGPTNANNILVRSSRRAEPTGMVPTRCLSPNSSTQVLRDRSASTTLLHQSKRASICRRFLQEVSLEDGRLLLHKGAGDEEEDLELLMLASLQRQQQQDDEDEGGGASGLSASQIRQCNVSVSMSSDDTMSTWTHMSMPANQGQHYQKEMNPLLHSNPREWMDVLSPPIIPPSQQRGSDSTWHHHHHHKDLIPEGDVWNEEEYLNLLYDPCLNCYFDPQTGKYYELA